MTLNEIDQAFPICQVEDKVTELKEHPADIASHVKHGSGWVAFDKVTCVRVGSVVKLISNDPHQPFIEGVQFNVKTLMKIPFHLIDSAIAEKVRMGVDQFRESLILKFGKSLQCSPVYLIEIERGDST